MFDVWCFSALRLLNVFPSLRDGSRANRIKAPYFGTPYSDEKNSTARSITKTCLYNFDIILTPFNPTFIE